MPTPTSDTRLKVRLEAPLRASVRALFRALAVRLRTGLAKGGVGLVVDVRGLAGEALQGILRAHYGRVGDAFAGRVARGLPADVAMDDAERAEVEARLSRLFDARARAQADRILATAQRDVLRAVRRAREALEGSDTLSLGDVPALASNTFLARALARSRSIATFETQAAAEAAKTVEAVVLSGLSSSVDVKALPGLLPPEPEKVWVSQGDSRVRNADNGSAFDHLEADGQRRKLSQLFEVSGEYLMHPGDTSHGASLGNVIGCRCDAVVDVVSIAVLRAFYRGLDLTPDPRVLRPTESDVVVSVPLI